MKKTITTIAALAATIIAHGASLDSLAVSIASSNPAYTARSRELNAASMSLQAEGMLPGPEIEGEHLWGPGGDNRWGAGVSQSFDWPGVYAARRAERRASGNAFAQLASAELAEQTLAAKLALIDLVAARRSAAIISEIYGNVQDLLRFTTRALDHGQATILDVRKLQIESLDIEQRLQQAELDRAAAVASLRAMGYDGDVPEQLGYPDAVPDYTAAEARWQSAPAVLAAKAEAEAAASRARVASRSMLPGFSIGYRHQFEGGHHFNGISASISLPAWGSGRARAAARAEAEAADMLAASAMAENTSRFDDARRRVAELGQRVERYSEAVGGADYPMLLRKSLDGGQISVLTYVQELNFFLEANLARAAAERDYHAALATLLKY